MPDLDIMCYYADLGRPYGPLLRRMTESAQANVPGARLVLITPTPDLPEREFFDLTIELPNKADETNLCLERSRAVVSWQLQTTRRAVYCDPDIAWLKPPPELPDGSVGLMWRRHKPDQPVNSGVVLATPGCREFWRRYAAVVANLPPALHSWWCDQLAYTVMTGACHEAGEVLRLVDADVHLLDGGKMVPTASKADGAPNAFALHYKGAEKEGDVWRHIYRGHEPLLDTMGEFGGGRSSPAWR